MRRGGKDAGVLAGKMQLQLGVVEAPGGVRDAASAHRLASRETAGGRESWRIRFRTDQYPCRWQERAKTRMRTPTKFKSS